VSAPNLRTQRTTLNFASGLAVTAATTAIAFFTTPLLLRWLGPERYGAVRAVSDWFGHLSVFELGTAGALPAVLALAIGQADASRLRALMAAGVRAYLRIGVLATLGALAITALCAQLVPVRADLASDLRTACLVGMIGVLLYPLAPYRALADAAQQGYLINFGLLAQSLVTTALALLFAHQRLGITGQFLAVVAGQVVFAVLLLTVGSRRVPDAFRAALGGVDAAARAELARLNLPTFWFMLSGRLGLLTDNIVVAGLLGPGRVVPLYLTQRLIGIAGGQLYAVGGASWAALAELHALGRKDTFNARLLDLTRLVAGLALAVMVPLVAFNRHFVTRWVGAVSFGGDAITLLAAANAYMLALVTLWTWVFSGTGQVRRIAGAAMASAVLNLALSVVGTLVIGIAGPLLGTFLGTLGINMWYVPRELERTFGTSAAALFRAATLPLLWSLPLGAGLAWLARSHAPTGWLMLGTEMALSGLLLLVFWWALALTDAERASFRARAAFAVRRGGA
jgi:O-antigen/teichoic acid export membrane protein